ncbi:hypothetical protein [Massilia sp. CF038]|uniref:hypothetical protein n=1 Tax=Massilia sp. CF038 TaxID=1881045 RepID=UPI000910D217|nr:hypothetical protein [Massilia sp. CF038]SHH01551.1 hypothetical protein SAMN05428948_2334 [Massilia sp. CF038]
MASAGETYILNYFLALDAARAGLDEADRQAEDTSLPEREQLLARVAGYDIEREIALLEIAHETFMAKFSGIKGPPEEVVARAIDLAAALADNIAKNLTAVAILQAVTATANAWVALSDPSLAKSGGEALKKTAPAAQPQVAVAGRKKKRISTMAWLNRLSKDTADS